MASLNWITPTGSLANILSNVHVTLQVQALDSAIGTSITYSIINGSLPTGLTMNSSGIFSGTPTTTVYATTEKFSFVVRAKSSAGYILDGGFEIILTNTVNNNFAWITPAGSLGTVPAGNFYSLMLEAESPNNIPITYELISGELPAGMRIVSRQATANVSVTTQTISNILPLDSARFVDVGYYVSGPNIPTGTTVSSVNLKTNTITLSLTPTGLFTLGTPIKFYSLGYIQGVPEFLPAASTNANVSSHISTYRFSVRAALGTGQIIDRSFSISLTNVTPPVILPKASDLGVHFDGTYFAQQLSIANLNPKAQITWNIERGELPVGVTLSDNGLLSGYIQPLQLVGNFGPANYDGETVSNGTIIDAEYDHAPYDFVQLNQSLTYSFTVQAFDGANYATQQYKIEVVGRTSWTADMTYNNVNDTYLTTDSINTHEPVLLTTNTVLPTGRQASYYAFKFDGTDFLGNNITYSVATVAGTFDAYVNSGAYQDLGFDSLWNDAYNGVITITRPGGLGSFDSFNSSNVSPQNLPGLILDAQTGWLYGKLNSQSTALQNYEFGVQVSSTQGNVVFTSKPKFFTLPVLGNVNNAINWITPSTLEPISNGTVSELVVEAVSLSGQPLVYSLQDANKVSAKLPQGLKLLPSGIISGRASFEAFSVDEGTTTFDSGLLTVDRTSVFTVVASTIDGSASSAKEFSIRLDVINQNPFENLYLNALLPSDQRSIYHSIISNTAIFDANVIYRPDDPWFGVSQNINMLFMAGLKSEDLNQFQTAIAKNHWTKSFDFGAIKTAVVLDKTYQVKYEVVYVELLDPEQTSITTFPPLEINLTGIIANPYIDSNGNQFKIIYPNASGDMITRLVNSIGYYDQSSLPGWMTSNQINSSNTATFNLPLGYTQAAVLAYTKPGHSNLIAYRLKKAGINFQNIKFTVDRYTVDNYYSTNFVSNAWVGGSETTFDALPRKNVGDIVADVNYAAVIPFDQIHGRPVDYIIARGGIDGVTRFTDGQTLVFAQQENFLPPQSYDGWVNYFDGYIGDNISTALLEGYDSEAYDRYTIIPGYLERASGTSATNQRGGIWRINISATNIVTLSFVREIEVNQRIQVFSGRSYNGAILYYRLPQTQGQAVPHYSIFNLNKDSIISAATTFNNGTTRFFSRRDQYYAPGTQGSYLKFPQTGPFPQ
ncbi:MAG TPA: hypothetical protein VFM18_18360 [Methanosarcina sp.]|nr:hypothetical protein [Methanosarcina sp.]